MDTGTATHASRRPTTRRSPSGTRQANGRALRRYWPRPLTADAGHAPRDLRVRGDMICSAKGGQAGLSNRVLHRGTTTYYGR